MNFHGLRLAGLLSLILCGCVVAAQQTPLPAVSFELNFPGSEPGHYLISIKSDCHATYESNGKLTPQNDSDDSFHFDFTVAQPTCTTIFDLTEKAHYFEGEIDLKKKRLASTGIKVLSYQDSKNKITKATYNYSPLSAVQRLTEIFQGISATVEFGHRLEYEHHYQKLALDQELKRMEESDGRSSLGDFSVIAPILQKIVDDPSLINVVRARAQRLLLTASK